LNPQKLELVRLAQARKPEARKTNRSGASVLWLGHRSD
jgi:hypothetical protein